MFVFKFKKVTRWISFLTVIKAVDGDLKTERALDSCSYKLPISKALSVRLQSILLFLDGI